MASTENDDPAQIAHRVRMANGQTADGFVVEKFDGTDVFKVDKDGYVTKTFDPDDADWTIWKSGATYYARDGSNGSMFTSGAVAQTVINAVTTEATEGDVVYVKPATYTVTGVIGLPKALRFQGGPGTLLQAGAGASVAMLQATAGEGTVIDGFELDANGVASLHGILLSGATLTDTKVMNCKSNATGYPYYIHLVDKCHIFGCEAMGSGDDGFSMTYGAPSRVMLTNCVSHDNDDSGFEAGDNATDITMTNCISYDNGFSGFTLNSHDDSTGPNNVSISGCQAINTVRGIYVGNNAAELAPAYNYSITGNTIRNCTGNAFVCSKGNRVAFVGNSCYNSMGAYVLGASNDVLIQGNMFDVNELDSTGVQVDAGCSHVSIDNNDIIKPGLVGTYSRRGIYVQSPRTLITRNRIYDSGYYGIHVLNADLCKIDGNILEDPQTYGLKVENSSYCSIINNTFEDVGSAVVESGTSDYNLFDHNIFNTVTTPYGIVGANSKIGPNNIGFVLSKSVLSSAFAIDSTGVKTLNVAHGLTGISIPSVDDISVTVVQDTAVDDWAYGFVKVDSVGATYVVCKVNVTTASGTGSATAKLGLKIDTR